MKKKILIPILISSIAFVSMTTAGVITAFNYINNQENAVTNPMVTLIANGGTFVSEGGSTETITRLVRHKMSWAEFKKNMPTPVKPGYDIGGWEYSDTSVEGTWEAVPDDYVFLNDVYLRVSNWSGAEAENFATDSWATLISIANQGIEVLRDTYHPSYGTFVIHDLNNEEEVAEKTRTVDLKGMGTYRVRVIGEDHDHIHDDTITTEDDKVAALTFEFVDAVEPSLGYPINKTSDSWAESNIKKYLDETFVNRLPDPLSDTQDGIRTVDKEYSISNGEGGRIIQSSSERFFVPSLSELGFENVPDGTDESIEIEIEPSFTYTYRSPANNKEVLDEGDAYQFYEMNYTNNDARVRYYTNYEGNQEKIAYWTRSPFTTTFPQMDPYTGDIKDATFVHVINESGLSSDYDELDRATGDAIADISAATNAVAPCFCIGVDDAHILNFVPKDTNDVVGFANRYIANNTPCYISLYDKRDMLAPTFPTPTSAEDAPVRVRIGDKIIPATETTEGGVSFTNYTFDSHTGNLVINIDKARHIIDDVVTVEVMKEQVNGLFTADDWGDFITNANLGYDKLKTTYSEDYAANGNTFIGLKRPITITLDETPVTFYARVIGENHDIDSNGKTIPLTFALTQSFPLPLLGIEMSEALPVLKYMDTEIVESFRGVDYNYDFTGCYTTSGIRQYLNGIDSELIPDYSFVKLLPEVLQNGITVASKKVNEIDNEIGGFKSTTFTDKLFLLSYEEYTGSSTEIALPGEGTCYEYYVNSSSASASRKYRHQMTYSDNELNAHEEFSGSNYQMSFTRSLYKDGDKVIGLNCDNGLFENIGHGFSQLINPAFCIGQN